MMKRLMWLLNHGTARKFELAIMKKLGVEEIYLPKIYPSDPRFRSVSVDHSEDQNLTIPKKELDILNAQNWYINPSVEAWEIANNYFPVIFFILYDCNLLKHVAKHYKGIAVWRTYGLDKTLSYSMILEQTNTKRYAEQLGERLIFGQAYPHLHTIERPFLAERRVDLPAGMFDCEMNDEWIGTNKKIYFVCPDIGFSVYYQQIYREFVEQLGDFPHAIAGSQPVYVSDPNILGFVAKEAHERNMREMRVMYYHSSEPNHIHYHPFEALKAGMPLIFMAGGILDQFGGHSLPGRCESIDEARKKIKRILNDDWSLIADIRKSQEVLLNPMRLETCYNDWLKGFQRIAQLVEEHKSRPPVIKKKKFRIALFFNDAINYELQLMIQMLKAGAKQAGTELELIFAFEQIPAISKEELAEINYRLFKWITLDSEASFRALSYEGCPQSLVDVDFYVPDDGINCFLDCDLWIFPVDCLRYPILPIRPYMLNLLNFSSSAEKNAQNLFDDQLISHCHIAEATFTTSSYLSDSLVRVIGVPENKVSRWVVCSELDETALEKKSALNRFFWVVDQNWQKNLDVVLDGLRIYYEELNGRIECHAVGLTPEDGILLTEEQQQWLSSEKRIVRHSRLSQEKYQQLLPTFKFLWHPSLTDSNLYTILDCSRLSISVLALRQPALECINDRFKLNMQWMDKASAKGYAHALKQMESGVDKRSAPLQKREFNKNMDQLKKHYWELVEQCL